MICDILLTILSSFIRFKEYHLQKKSDCKEGGLSENDFVKFHIAKIPLHTDHSNFSLVRHLSPELALTHILHMECKKRLLDCEEIYGLRHISFRSQVEEPTLNCLKMRNHQKPNVTFMRLDTS